MVEADMVITAIGQASDPNFLAADTKVKTTKRGTFEVDAMGLATNVEGIFAAGDVTNTYAEQVLVAVGEGAKAALSAYDYLLTLP
mgnify:CR=1 FL=1